MTQLHPGVLVHNSYFETPQARESALAEAGYKYVGGLYSGGWDWDCIDVFKRLSNGKLFYITDSGCSCYGPYDYAKDESFDPTEIDSYQSFRDMLNTHYTYEHTASDRQALLRKVSRNMR